MQPVFVLAEQVGNVTDREDGCDRRHDQAGASARELGLSDAEVARRAGLSERRYGYYATGEREPNLATLVPKTAILLVARRFRCAPLGYTRVALFVAK